ncbi:MAG: SiaB family protein kinase [Bacteroidales bacterium]|nr:SiaB family protein kinase [Bacteroidales bacterium]
MKKYDIDEHFLTGISTIYDSIIGNGINLVYIGKFNHNVIKMFSAMAEDDMKKTDTDVLTKRRVYHTIIEILQNMSKHSDEIAEASHTGRGLFMIGKKRDNYFIITSNRIKNKHLYSLKVSIEQINNSNIEELNEMYSTQLRDGKLSSKGGAGLGLIDIARKTSKALQFNFIPINNFYSYFVLKVMIDKRKISD